MSDNDKLIAEARREYDAYPSRAAIHPRPISLRLADALEAALEVSRVPTPAETEDEHEKLMMRLVKPTPELERLREVWTAFGCAYNPDDFKESVQEEMWAQVLQFCRDAHSENNRIFRENVELRNQQPRIEVWSRQSGKTESLVDSILNRANERGIEVKIVAPVTPAEGEAEEWAKFIENAHEEWCEENENRDPFHFDSWCAVARAVLARRSPVETEDNWEYGVKWGDEEGTNLCGTLERAQKRASADFGDVIVRRRKRREVPAGPWLLITEEKK